MRKNVCFWNILKVRLQRTLTTCVRKCGLWRLFLLARGVCEFTQKLSLDSIYCLIFHVGIILFAFHSQSKNISYFLAIGCLIGVRICSNGTSKSMVCIWFAINTAWLERPGKSATPNLAPTRFTTAVRTLRFGNIPSEDTFHISLPKRRRRTVAFRAPAIVCEHAKSAFQTFWWKRQRQFEQKMFAFRIGFDRSRLGNRGYQFMGLLSQIWFRWKSSRPEPQPERTFEV